MPRRASNARRPTRVTGLASTEPGRRASALLRPAPWKRSLDDDDSDAEVCLLKAGHGVQVEGSALEHPGLTMEAMKAERPTRA